MDDNDKFFSNGKQETIFKGDSRELKIKQPYINEQWFPPSLFHPIDTKFFEDNFPPKQDMFDFNDDVPLIHTGKANESNKTWTPLLREHSSALFSRTTGELYSNHTKLEEDAPNTTLFKRADFESILSLNEKTSTDYTDFLRSKDKFGVETGGRAYSHIQFKINNQFSAEKCEFNSPKLESGASVQAQVGINMLHIDCGKILRADIDYLVAGGKLAVDLELNKEQLKAIYSKQAYAYLGNMKTESTLEAEIYNVRVTLEGNFEAAIGAGASCELGIAANKRGFSALVGFGAGLGAVFGFSATIKVELIDNKVDNLPDYTIDYDMLRLNLIDAFNGLQFNVGDKYYEISITKREMLDPKVEEALGAANLLLNITRTNTPLAQMLIHTVFENEIKFNEYRSNFKP